MRRIIVLGKGGIGKSTLVVNLAILARRAGQRTLQIGCDPKHDSYLRHLPEGGVVTVMDKFLEAGKMTGAMLQGLITPSRTGVHVLEAGGPEPGKGCAGRAVSLTLDLLDDCKTIVRDYDVAIYDVLGDVVCGGFAAPLRRAEPADVVLVASAEYLAMYAANNIAKGVRNLASIGSARLVGLVGNKIHDQTEARVIEEFAQRLGSRMLGFVPYAREIARADAHGLAVLEDASLGGHVPYYEQIFEQLAQVSEGDRVVPTPLGDTELRALCFDLWNTGDESSGTVAGKET